MSSNQEPRRRFLRQMLAVVPAASVTTGGALTQAACSKPSPPGDTPVAGAYRPDYFTADEWQFLQAAVDRLIPADSHGAGALAAGVPEYIDRQMETPYGYGKLWYTQGPFHTDQPAEMGFQLNLAPRDVFRLGIRACDAHCRARFAGKPFAQLAQHEQETVLGQMEHAQIGFESVPAQTFFAFLLAHAKEGFFADPIYGGNKDMVGWKMIGFTGARADFADWIDQPGVKYPYGPVSIDGRRG
ncbi:gluconate 2-dehydrogenase gamma chain [Paraburkholderia bannensis]|uniref:Gluconate 2-dehydrogenase gamma chain n=1 Tax=Paraburkholderia bannensis TaxID=765414 RepID=A0A7W9TYX4_9BURK|nr:MULTISPECIES: gluconate 2-dehydrogenase subunit 3 family protein [Paraburkholderia]MBB3257892.1 gluconate 2-dehydrogenase gamma chain [Paraburkholderia sp. WP4_3_2]MBB6102905.1 gluconate 2-dehydrogenase gamma chain [Paraburkholderia bannensis]